MRAPGDSFAHYTIESLLGQGGMGEVYRAFDTKLHRRVALKLLLAPETTSEDARKDATARMIREARAAAAVDHPNKVGVHELGEVDGVPYIAMEYIAGTTLRPYVGDDSVPWAQKLSWLLDVARALDAAHAAGLVHRDIKPENVMLREDGIVKVLDFGIARRADAPVDASGPTVAPGLPALTGAGVVIGTAAYMPPEQMQGRELDGRADQFAWGVMAFELLAGKHPWDTPGDTLALVGMMLTQPAAPLGRLRPEVPEVVALAIARTLAAKREDRFPRMGDLVDELVAAVGVTGKQMAAPAARVVVGAGGVTTNAAIARTEVSAKRSSLAVASPRRRGRVLGIGATIALVATAGIAGVWRWQATRTTVEYCIELVTTSRGPKCRVRGDEKTMGQRRQTFRVTSGAGGVRSIEQLNRAGLPLGSDDEGVHTEIRRADDGAVLEIIERNQDQQEVSHEVWKDGGARIDLVEADGSTARHFRDSRVTRLAREFDGSGHVRRERGLGASGKARANTMGVFGVEYERAPDGFVTRMTHLGADGKPMADGRGIAAVVHISDARGVEVEARNLDIAGNPSTADGAAIVRVEYTPALDRAGYTYFDAAGAKAASLQSGVHGTHDWRDSTGRKWRSTFVDENGKSRARKGNAYSSLDGTLDARGREVEALTLDATGNPVVTAAINAAGVRIGWDDHDHPVAISFLGPLKEPVQGAPGYSTRRDTYDALGWDIEQRHFNERGELAPWRDGGAIVRMTRDDRGLLTALSNFDENDKPVANKSGVTSWRTKFDRLRNDAESARFGVDGKPTTGTEGVAVWRDRYDDDDNLIESSTFDASGAPTFQGAFAKKRLKYDDRGFVVEEAYFDTNDNPLLTKDGFATIRIVRDRSGDVIEESTFGRRGEPIARAGGYARKTNTYDLHRRRVETALFDASGKPVVGADAWSIERTGYEERGLVIRVDHLDAAGEAVLDKAGRASTATKWDGRGNVVEVTSLGKDGRPVVAKEGWATKKTTYDERDLPIEEGLFGADGATSLGPDGWAVRKLRYDERSNRVEESFFDAERRPVTAKSPTYASKRDAYDARLRLVETTYYDPAGAPVAGPDGVARIRYQRDGYGRAMETAYLDSSGTPAWSTEGKQIVRAKYDDAGRLIEELFDDATGTMRTAKDGCTGHRTKYDERGRKIEETCLDEKNGLALSKAGWAAKRSLHDARGNVVDEATYSPDGKLTPDATGVARKKSRYDERSLLQDTAFFDADDKPVKDKRGVASVRFRYDDAGKQIEETLFDDKGKPVVLKGAKSKG